jgi:hypothetical protein
MARLIDQTRKKIVKAELWNGASARWALRQAGYSEGTIRLSTKNKVVQDCIKEINQSLDTWAKPTV